MNAEQVLAGVSPGHALVLRAALCERAVAEQAWHQWRSSVDFDDIDHGAERLMPLIARRGDVIPVDDPVRRRVAGLYRRTWVNNHRMWSEAVPLISALDEAGIAVMVLKGGALLRWYGDDWGIRPMYDVDLAVPVASLDSALGVFERNGWTPEMGQTTSWVRWRMRRSRHSWGFSSAQHGRVDLHWRVLSGSMWDGADDEFWAGSSHVDIGGLRCRCLAPADLLVHVLLHGVHESNRPPAQWVADVVKLCRGIAPSEMPSTLDRFVMQARRHGALRVARAGLEAVQHMLGEASVAPFLRALEDENSVLERLRHHRGLGAGPLKQLSRNSTGGAGIVRGAIGLVARRMEIDLVTRRPAAVLYGMTGRSPVVARLLRRRSGPFVRSPEPWIDSEHPPGVMSFDLSDPTIVDAVGATGWALVGPRGADTMGRESRLLLPHPGVSTMTVQLVSRGVAKSVDVLLDHHRVWRGEVGTSARVVTVPVGAPRNDGVLDVSVRARRRRWPPLLPPLELTVGRIELTSLGGAH